MQAAAPPGSLTTAGALDQLCRRDAVSGPKCAMWSVGQTTGEAVAGSLSEEADCSLLCSGLAPRPMLGTTKLAKSHLVYCPTYPQVLTGREMAAGLLQHTVHFWGHLRVRSDGNNETFEVDSIFTPRSRAFLSDTAESHPSPSSTIHLTCSTHPPRAKDGGLGMTTDPRRRPRARPSAMRL